VWRGVDAPAVGGVCVCASGRDVAEGRGLLGEGGEGALERLDADGVHVGHRGLDVQIDPWSFGGREEAETEETVGQRKAILPGQHKYMGAILLGSQQIAFCKAGGANRSNRRCCWRNWVMLDHVARLLTASWHSSRSRPHHPHIHQVSNRALIAPGGWLPVIAPVLPLSSVTGPSAADLRLR
jgi:hypothetical protein